MKTKKPKRDFTEGLLGLISEPEFVIFENLLKEPNFFRIVGRTHYERWHSAFIGWLLDANGSHLLRDYVLMRLLFLLHDRRCLKPTNHERCPIFGLLPSIKFVNIEVTPNEYVPVETSVNGVGRFDVFVTATYTDNLQCNGRLNAIVELKIDSKIRSEQSERYAEWLARNHPDDVNLLIYILPNLLSDSKATVGDDRWYCLDYQLLHDKLLIPILNHPNLNDKVKVFILQYIKNLRYSYGGIRMAVTDEEKRLARALYEKYGDVFDAIYDALQMSDTIDYSTSELQTDRGRASGKIAVRVNGNLFVNDTVLRLFTDILVYLVDQELVIRIPLPWGTSSKRYIITNQEPPKHPSGREFFYPAKYKGYAMESHYARERAMKILDDLCRKLEISFEPVEV